MSDLSPHQPARPTWDCLRCGRAWPCLARRRELVAEFGRERLALCLYLAGHFVDAIDDLPHAAEGELYRRFLGWMRPAGQRPSDTAAAMRSQARRVGADNWP